jgi:hypothetical protein
MKNKQSIKLNINRERPQNKTREQPKLLDHIFLSKWLSFYIKNQMDAGEFR